MQSSKKASLTSKKARLSIYFINEAIILKMNPFVWFASLKDLKVLFYYLRMDQIFCTCDLDMYVFCCQFG